MAGSGAGVSEAKIRAVIDYLQEEFPDCEINHVPKGDQIADLFQIIRSSEAVHRLRIRRAFFDRYETQVLPYVIAVEAIERMKKAGPEIVDLG